MHSSIKRIPFTKETLDKMKSEYAELVEEEKQLIVRLQVAREMGDLSENGAYKYAKIELGNTRRRLRELKRLIERAVIIQPKSSDTVQLGSTVTLKNNQEEMTFTIVSKYEANPIAKKISDESPIGRAVMGRKFQEYIEITLPQNKKSYQIIKIQ